MAGPVYFAWSDAEELDTFGVGHWREDEDVFSLVVAHAEGEFPTATVAVRNPRVGLLGLTRKRWAWISYRDPGGAVHPLIFGRLVGVPQQLQDEVVSLTFVARPTDYESQKGALAEELRQAPWWDPIWFSPEARADPDTVLEARAALWHIDRVTHQVTVSDILTGDGPLIELADVPYDSVQVTWSGSPARRVSVEATVRWEQRGTGVIDVTRRLYRAFAEAQSDDVKGIDGTSYSTRGQIVLATGEQMINAWPRKGARIGGGWSVDESDIRPIAGGQTPPMILRPGEHHALGNQSLAGAYPMAVRSAFGRGPGLTVQVVDYTDEQFRGFQSSAAAKLIASQGSGANILWVPLWRMAASMHVRWTADRKRTETIRFDLDADVQPVLSEPGDEAVVHLSLGTADVDASERGGSTEADTPIGDFRRPSYFRTDRGRVSLEHAVARARAILQARARAVEISCEVPFEALLAMSCRRECLLVDPRLPGGQARGKVKAYGLHLDGDTGAVFGTLTLGAAIGRGGEAVAVPGAPSYVADGYVADGYQLRTGATYVLPGDDVSIAGIDDQPIDDDGVDLTRITTEGYLLEAAVTGGLSYQREEVEVPGLLFETAFEAIDRINAVETTVRLELRPVTGGPFETEFEPALSTLRLPKMIDLEAA